MFTVSDDCWGQKGLLHLPVCMVAAMYMDLLQDTLADMGPVTSTTGEASPTGAVRSNGK